MGKIPGGYILQPRCFDGSEAAHFPPCTREVWFYLLRNVNHADNGKLNRGGGLFHLENMQDDLSWNVGYRRETYSKPQLTKALRRLREGNMIETAKATRGVYVTVLNYDKYQEPKNYEGNAEGNAKETRRKREGMQEKQEWKNERIKEEKQTQPSQEKTTGESRFETFWKSYPKKVAKKDALKAWEKQKCGNGIFETVMEKLEQFKSSNAWTRDNGRYIPNPASWINGERWNDEIQCDIKKQGQKVGGYTF